MAEPSDSIVLPPPSIVFSRNNSPTKLSSNAFPPPFPTTASFSANRSTKLSLSVVIPPSAFTSSFSRSSPIKSSPSAALPPSPITASSPSSCNSVPTKLSPKDALPLSTSTPTKLSPITHVLPPFPKIVSSSNSPTNLSPSDALPPSSNSSRSSSTKLSPTATLPSSSTSPTQLSTFLLTSSSNGTPTELSPSIVLPPPSNILTKLSPTTTLPPSKSSPTELSPNATLSPSNRSPTKLSLNPTLPPPSISLTEISPCSAPKVQQIATLPPSNSCQKSLPGAALPPSPKLSPTAALPQSPRTPSSSSSGFTINVSDLQCCIDDVMSALIDKGQKCILVESGNKLKDTVQHVSSDFSTVFGSIAEGSKIISDQKSCFNIHSVTSEIIKEVANIHWAAIGLLTIANVLERFDKISVNDRDCFDLLKAMLDLAKVLKQLKDDSFDLHKEIAEKMVEALSLIWSGAKLCRSFIAHKKILKFFFTTKIRDDLVYIRRKMDGMIVQLSLQIQIKNASFNISRRQPYSDSAGGRPMFEPTGFPCDQSATTNETLQSGLPSEQLTTTNENIHCGLSCEQSTTTDEILQCEMDDAAQAETCPRDSHIEIYAPDPKVVSQVDEGESDEPVSCKKERPKKSKRRFFRLPAYLKKFKDGRGSPTQRKQMPAKKVVVGVSMDKKEMCWFSIEGDSGGMPTIHFPPEELDNATNGFRHQVKSSHARFNMFKGSLTSGRQVQVRRFPSQEASTSEQDNRKIMLDELRCMLHLRHKHIVKLVGLCNIEKEEPMLVYEYPPNGRLCDFLQGDSKNEKDLDWSDRSKILKGVISALVYLHEEADERTYWVHSDIKPENILLDGNFNAKLSDFSLAKVVAFNDSSSGYKEDIQRFGLLVLQVVSGSALLPTTYDGDVVNPRIFRPYRLYKEDRLHELIDPQLLEREGCEFTSIIRCIKIALWCVMVTDPSLRPKTSQVSAMLSTEQEIPPLPDDCLLIEPHSNESNESVRSVEGGQSEVGIEEVIEPRA